MDYIAKNLNYIHLNNEDKRSTIDNTDNVIGTYSLAANPKIYEIQRNNNFKFYIEGLSTIVIGLVPNNTAAAANADDVIEISISKAFVPHFTQTPIVISRGNNKMKFAGVPEFGEGSLALDDFIGAGTKDILLAWQSRSYNVRTEKVGLASDYKRDAWLLEYTPDYQLVRTWKLEGCWISGLSEDEYNHDSGEKHSITATIQYDKAYPDYSDIAPQE